MRNSIMYSLYATHLGKSLRAFIFNQLHRPTAAKHGIIFAPFNVQSCDQFCLNYFLLCSVLFLIIYSVLPGKVFNKTIILLGLAGYEMITNTD